jgi:hypothetical protein
MSVGADGHGCVCAWHAALVGARNKAVRESANIKKRARREKAGQDEGKHKL